MKTQSKAMLEVHQKKNKIQLEDPHPNKLIFRAIFNSSIDVSYVSKCIKNILKRSEERIITKFITFAQKGMLMLIISKYSCNRPK